MKARFINADGTFLQQVDKMAIANLPLQALWSQIEIYLRGILFRPLTATTPGKRTLNLLTATTLF